MPTRPVFIDYRLAARPPIPARLSDQAQVFVFDGACGSLERIATELFLGSCIARVCGSHFAPGGRP